jgi:nucleotide-binding universal stress UspA family protein
MFKRIAVACNDSPESRRALASAIRLASILGAELRVVTVEQELPAYTAFATACDSSLTQTLREDQSLRCEQIQAEARTTALREGVVVESYLLQGNEVDALIGFLHNNKPDLLVIGLHRHTSHVSRLWNTVFEIAQDAPCSVLGVH